MIQRGNDVHFPWTSSGDMLVPFLPRDTLRGRDFTSMKKLMNGNTQCRKVLLRISRSTDCLPTHPKKNIDEQSSLQKKLHLYGIHVNDFEDNSRIIFRVDVYANYSTKGSTHHPCLTREMSKKITRCGSLSDEKQHHLRHRLILAGKILVQSFSTVEFYPLVNRRR